MTHYSLSANPWVGRTRIPPVSPVVLLLVVGTFTGLNLPLSKIAVTSGVSPLAWAWLLSASAALSLGVLAWRNGPIPRPRGQAARYVVLAGGVSFVVPHLLLFAVIPHVGAGYSGLMLAASPIFTLALWVLLGKKAPGRMGYLGIGLGFFGTALVALAQGQGLNAPGVFWLVIAVAVPAILALGNVYRTLDWPKGASMPVLAFWAYLVATVVSGIVWIAVDGLGSIRAVAEVPGVTAVQIAVSAMAGPLYFRLQRDGGPVLLSQMGNVAAAVALISGTVLLGEVYPRATWVGTGIIGLSLIAAYLAQTGAGRAWSNRGKAC